MSGKFLGISLTTILVVIVTAIVVKKWGANIPGLNKIT